MAELRPVLQDDKLYECGDRILCGRHAGQSARWTGRTIHGVKVRPVGPATRRQMTLLGMECVCESCKQLQEARNAESRN